MKKLSQIVLLTLFTPAVFYAQDAELLSPDQKTKVQLFVENGKAEYKVFYDNKIYLEKSPLGLTTDFTNFTKGLKLIKTEKKSVSKDYSNEKIKKSQVSYRANALTAEFSNAEDKKIAIEFQVSNNNIAFRYDIPKQGERLTGVVLSEATGYQFPKSSTTFLSPMSKAMTGFERSAPSYESGYKADAPIGEISETGEGFVFPGLFHVGSDGWVLLSETGVSSNYCASQLSNGQPSGLYNVQYPSILQNNGFGSTGAAISLPAKTPWRTITISNQLKNIVETTIPFDVVDPLYEPSKKYTFGKATWSWIVWQDPSMNYDDQVKFIDLASEMKYEYILIDALWDVNIGKVRMKDLMAYAHSKNVDILLWYNSNGTANDAPMGPRNIMNSSIERKKEMKWLQQMGVKGLKVDFFGGDKQETMRLYEDILSDANDYGLTIIFHGATLPRGWEVMYPNFVGSEAVLASEMLVFVQEIRNQEAFFAALHPFIRNNVASMEFGGVFLNKFLNKENKKGNQRLTTDAFQLATGVLFQNPVQVFAITPNNLVDAPSFAIDFMKNIPTTWDDTVFIEGYPGKYVVLARKKNNQWYIAGVNAEKTPKKLKLHLPMIESQKLSFINDEVSKKSYQKTISKTKNNTYEIEIQPNGGFVLTTDTK